MAMRPKVRKAMGIETRPDARRISASAAGYDWEWSKPNGTADQARERDENMCQQCLREGGIGMAMAEMAARDILPSGEARKPPVDHIVPAHVIGEWRFHDLSNLQTLCRKHHSQKTAEDLKKYGAANR